FQPERDEHWRPVLVLRVLLAQCANERDLSGARIADEQSVRASADHGPPRTVAKSESLTVLGVLHVRAAVHQPSEAGGSCEWQRRRIVLDERVEKPIDGRFETRAIA